MSEEKAIVRMGSKGLVFSDVEGLWRFAELVTLSGDMCPKGYINSPKKVVVAVQMGAEIGLSPMKSLQSIAVINGVASIWGDAALGLVKASGICEFIREKVEGEGDDMVASVESKRTDCDDIVTTTFSVADAKTAHLWGKKGTWTTHPYRMLKYKARAFNLRDNFPDILGGFHLREEMEFPEPEYQPTTPRREERKQVDNVADKIDNADAIQAVVNAFEAMCENQNDVKGEFLAYCVKVCGGEPDDYISAETFTIDVLDKLSISIQEWRDSQDGPE